MHRIDTLDQKGKPSYKVDEEGRQLFRSGNPHRREKESATILDPAWFNTVQENICMAITKQGIELTKGNDFQLHNAIVASSYRYQILSHLRSMVEFLRPVSDEITLPNEVNYNSNILEVLSQVIDALDHISDEAEIPSKPQSISDVDGIVSAINILISGVDNQSERNLGLTPILKIGD